MGLLAGPGATRFVLAILVICYHFTPLRSGNLAVCCFYILSGYWITKMWKQKYSKAIAPQATFLISRWLRIAPMLMLCTGLVVLLPIDRSGATPGWLLRQALIIGCTGPYVPLAPAWSLDVELQFYLAFATFAPWLLSLKQPSRVLGWLFVVSITISLVAAGIIVNIIKPWLWIWLPLFLAGMWMETTSYTPTRRHILMSFGILALGFGLCIVIPSLKPLVSHIPRASLSPEQQAVLPIRTSIDLVASLIAIPLLAANLTSKPSASDAFLGRMSFPLYLWHWIPHTALVLGIQNTGFAPWVDVTLAVLESLIGGYLLTLVDTQTDRLRSTVISWVNRSLNKHQIVN
ncbi:MAG: acyltransferase family protein [Armatimonadota bacterium]